MNLRPHRRINKPKFNLHGTLMVVALIVGVVIAVLSYLAGHSGQQAVDQGKDLANKVSIACSNRAILAQLQQIGACQVAQQVQAEPPQPGQPGRPGQNGQNGKPGQNGQNGHPGRGIRNTNIANGHLFVTYTDNTTTDLGQVVGAVGAKGDKGDTGKGIIGTALGGTNNLDLIVSYTDGTHTDVGTVVGPKGDTGAPGNQGQKGDTGDKGDKGDPGRSVASVNINGDFHLIVNYDDGTSSDAGPIPAGPQGVGVQSVALQTDANGQCELVFTLINPANQQQTTQSVLVNQVVCPVLPPPTTVPPTSTGNG